MDYTSRVAKTKALISCAVTEQLICVFVFAYADYFSGAAAQISLEEFTLKELKCCVSVQILYFQI